MREAVASGRRDTREEPGMAQTSAIAGSETVVAPAETAVMERRAEMGATAGAVQTAEMGALSFWPSRVAETRLVTNYTEE